MASPWGGMSSKSSSGTFGRVISSTGSISKYFVIVRGLHAFLEQESKVVPRHVVPAVVAFDNRKPLGKCPCFRNIGRITNDFKKLVAVHREAALPTDVRHRVATMPGKEHPPRSVEQFARPVFASSETPCRPRIFWPA